MAGPPPETVGVVGTAALLPPPPVAEISPTSHLNDSETVVLEDYLTKQGSRSKNFWHDRYFVLTADGRLRYFNKKGDSKPKASLLLNQLPDCEVSELYVAKQKSQLLYCVKITWTVEASGAAGNLDDTPFSDNESIYSAPTVLIQGEDTDNEMAGEVAPIPTVTTTAAAIPTPTASDEPAPAPTTTAAPAKKSKRKIFRKRNRRQDSSTSISAVVPNTSSSERPPLVQQTSSRDDSFQMPQPKDQKDQQHRSSTPSVFRTPPRGSARRNSNQRDARSAAPVTTRSVDAESLTVGTRAQPPAPLVTSTQSNDESEIMPRIPAMVEVQEEPNPQDTTNAGTTDSDTLTVRASNNNRNSMTKTPYDDEMDDEMEYLRSQFLATEKEKKRITKRKVAEGAKFAAAAGAAVGVAVVTVGIGLVAGLVALGVGAAAGASGTATGVVWKKKRDGVVVIGTMDYDKMRRWKACLDASLNCGIIQKSKWGQLFVGDGNKRRMLIFPKANNEQPLTHAKLPNRSIPRVPSPDAASTLRQRQMGLNLESAAKWRPLEGGWTSFLGTGPQGLRIFQEEKREVPSVGRRRQMLFRNLSVDGRPCAPLKSHLVLNATPLDAFLCLMSQGQLLDTSGPLSPNSGQRSSFRIIESIDDNTDVIHLVCNPLYLFPSWTTARDFVLYRYWRLEEDGSFIVCYESVQHKDCPPHPGYCRGEMHQVFTVAPHKKAQRRKGGSTKDQLHECLMTAVVQVDPKGWVPIAPLNMFSNQGYGDAFAVAALMQLLDIRDAIDQDRFIPVSLDDNIPFAKAAVRNSTADEKMEAIPHVDSMGSEDPFHEDLVNYDFAFADREAVLPDNSPTGLTTTPPPLPVERWAEPDANSFRVRGRNYLEDRRKINAGASIGRLVAVDIVQVDAPIYTGLTTHPTERVQLALQKEKILKEKGLESDTPPFLFVMNIIVPGPPVYHCVFYFAIDDMSTIDGSDGTPSSLLCKKFLFGDSDEFRSKTFKLIPQIVQGNFIVRKAVGSTPAILGRKIQQLYVRTDRSFEVVVDCGMNPVATGVIRLSIGYAKTLVVDMGFLLEGAEEEYLPERLMGCVRIRHVDIGTHLRKVEQPPPMSPRTSETGDRGPAPMAP